MADFQFVGGAYEAPSIYQDAQELINWFCELDPNDLAQNITSTPKRGVLALYPTPGFTLKVKPAASEVRALRTLSGGNVLLAIIGNAVYSINPLFVAVKVGTMLTSSGIVSIEDNGVAAYLVDGPNRYSYVIATSTFALIPITDGAFTGGDRVAVTDNYLIYNRPGTQQWAASTPLSTATSALSFSSKDGNPDNLVSLISLNREIFLLGEVSSEVWADIGAFPFPFQRITGTNTQHGCAAKHSVSRIGDTFAFLGQDQRGQGIVYHGEGYAFKRMSNHSVENSLVGKVINDARAFTYQIEGHEFYVLILPTADLTWVYDVTTEKWHKWLSVDSKNVFHRHRANCHAVFQGMNLIGDYQNGSIYQLSNTVYTDNGSTIRRVRRCPHLVSDFARQFFDSLQIQFQPGVGLATGQGSTPKAMLRWSDDGGSTWSNEHWANIGKMGKYKNRIIWRRLGYARDRIFEVVVTDPVKAVIISANLMASVGDS